MKPVSNQDIHLKCDCGNNTFTLEIEVRLEGVLATRYAICISCGRKERI